MARILKTHSNETSIDYGMLVEWASSGPEMLRAYYYDCLPCQSPSSSRHESDRLARQQRFFDALSYVPSKIEMRREVAIAVKQRFCDG